MDHLLAETGHFENHDHWAIRAGPWKPFNSHFLRQTAVNTVGSTHKRHHMVFVEQHGRRRILNIRELTTMAWNIFRVNRSLTLHRPSPQQVHMVQRATLTFSPLSMPSFGEAARQSSKISGSLAQTKAHPSMVVFEGYCTRNDTASRALPKIEPP